MKRIFIIAQFYFQKSIFLCTSYFFLLLSCLIYYIRYGKKFVAFLPSNAVKQKINIKENMLEVIEKRKILDFSLNDKEGNVAKK